MSKFLLSCLTFPIRLTQCKSRALVLISETLLTQPPYLQGLGTWGALLAGSYGGDRWNSPRAEVALLSGGPGLSWDVPGWGVCRAGLGWGEHAIERPGFLERSCGKPSGCPSLALSPLAHRFTRRQLSKELERPSDFLPSFIL